MKHLLLMTSMVLLLATGCTVHQEEEEIWGEVQFRVALRSEPYHPGDRVPSGDFEDLLLIPLPIRLEAGPGEAHAIQKGVWMHMAWDNLSVEEKPQPLLVFDGFRTRIENRFASPYGSSWWDMGWQKRGRTAISTNWDQFQTAVGINPAGRDTRIWCKLWRWTKTTSRPDIILGARQGGESGQADVPIPEGDYFEELLGLHSLTNRGPRAPENILSYSDFAETGAICGVRLGMSMSEAVQAWGKPRTTSYSGNGTYWQLGYGDCSLQFTKNRLVMIAVGANNLEGARFDNQLSPGMTRAEVIGLLGEPSQTSHSGVTYRTPGKKVVGFYFRINGEFPKNDNEWRTAKLWQISISLAEPVGSDRETAPAAVNG